MLPIPTSDYVAQQLAAFDGTPRYHGAESTVSLVFSQWPRNEAFEQVLAKVVVLNRLYSTNIYDPYTVAEHIVKLRIDDRLLRGDPLLVRDVATVTLGGKTRVLYSFATKYCSWHRPEHYQIYDSFVDWLLWQYRKQFEFAKFKRQELGTYVDFVRIVDRFREHFGLAGLSRKQVDKFLWIEGVEQWQLAAKGASGKSLPPTEVEDASASPLTHDGDD